MRRKDAEPCVIGNKKFYGRPFTDDEKTRKGNVVDACVSKFQIESNAFRDTINRP